MMIQLITLNVSDLEKSLDFYTRLLGLPLARRFGTPAGAEIAMLGEAGCTNLELVCMNKPVEPGAGRDVSIGFAFPDIDAMANKFSAEGYLVTDAISPAPSVRFRYVSDPDGYRIQLHES